MEKQAQVLDASVIVKWFAKEIDSEKAEEILKKFKLEELNIIVPDFLFLEVTNSLIYKRHDEETLAEANKNLWDSGLKVEQINELLVKKAIGIARKYNLTIYDSIYIALAQFYGCPLITADKELYKIPNVVPLSKI